MKRPIKRGTTFPERLRQRYQGHRAALADAAEAQRGSRKRGLVMGVGGLLVLGSMQQLVTANVMAVNFYTTNTPFTLYTNYLQGEQVAAYLNQTTRNAGGTAVPVAELGVKTASLAGLCMIATEDLPGGLGSYSLVLTAGDQVPGNFQFQNALPITDPNYGLPTGWTSGTDVWAAGSAAPNEYVGALKGTRAANAVRASDLFLNATNLGGTGYKVSGMYLGERAQDVGPNAGVTWETNSPQISPLPPDPGTLYAGGFGLRVDHLNLAGAAMEKSVPQAEVVAVTSPSGNTGTAPESVSSIADANSATKWYIGNNTFTGAGGTTTTPRTARYQLAAPVKVLTYSLTSANDTPARDPRNFTLQGSNNGTSWTTIDTVTGNSFAGRFETKSFTIDTPASYSYYLLSVTAVQSGTNGQLADFTLGAAEGAATGSSYGMRLKGTINLPKLKISVVPGAQTQSYCPTAAQ